ncbi:MAG: RNase P modulator RnpM [Christensenellales bacterium]|jgi:predicted RNA-binding protein YlxR (DUF448 family)
MRQRKVPMRMCVGCREKMPKRSLIRVVRDTEGVVRVDATGKVSGRGAYLCPGSAACLKRAMKSKLLEKNLGAPVDEALYRDLERQIQKTDECD